MTAEPCGVYVSLADLRATVSGTPNVSKDLIREILHKIDIHWKGQDIVDVIPMAECFWRWQHEMTSGGMDLVKSFEFEAIMERIKDEKLLPTIARRSDIKH